ncbi:thioredoxin-like protein [Rickenella mellea]|uniref:Thioredoxin-like protein n=1 Tax=Rickenella mellea TaxID=50990 RepID=A0A4Y7PJJ9_9AGAM|nr:thioredoxin-like protein [Rickenella mellea]
MSSIIPKRSIKVDVISDVLCPFCFLGKRKLDRAIKITNQKGLNVKVERKFHPFLLRPDLKLDSSLIEKKFGKEGARQRETALRESGQEEGINFSGDGTVSQTTDAHRLSAYAYDKGGEEMQLTLLDNLFCGHFEQGRDFGSHEFLAEQAVVSRLFPTKDEAKAWLSTDKKKEEVLLEIACVELTGVTGVPLFIIDNKYTIAGAQDPDVFVNLFEKLAHSE